MLDKGSIFRLLAERPQKLPEGRDVGLAEVFAFQIVEALEGFVPCAADG
jgi:hypothetical protein